MLSPSYSISPKDLWHLIGTADAPQLIDVRRRDIYESTPGMLPASIWQEPTEFGRWSPALDRTRPIVIACKAGKELSQFITAELRGAGYSAAMLEGGSFAWSDAGLPKVDRIACPWLIRRFLDVNAKILFVDPAYVKESAIEAGGIPFDIKDIELSHDGDRCTFDTMLKLFGLESEPSLARLALIVRGADTARPDIAPEAAG